MQYSQNLTIEDLKKVVEELEAKRPKHNFIKSDILKGHQVLIKSGNNIYYSPDITSGEVTLIETPSPNDILTKCGRINREAVEKGIKF